MAMIQTLGIWTLIFLELAYLAALIIPYWKHRHLKTILLFVPKILQAVLMLIVECLILAYYSGLREKELSLTTSEQKQLTTLLFISNIVEYVFLALNIFLLAKMFLEQRNRKKSDERYRKHVEDSNSVFVYKEVAEVEKIKSPEEPTDKLALPGQVNMHLEAPRHQDALNEPGRQEENLELQQEDGKFKVTAGLKKKMSSGKLPLHRKQSDQSESPQEENYPNSSGQNLGDKSSILSRLKTF